MTTGRDVDPTRQVRQGGPEWQRSFLALPVEHEPGTHFVYNSAVTYMLSAIVQQLTGQRLLDFIESAYRRHLGTQAPAPNPVVASGAWTSDDTYTVELWWYQTPFRRTLSYRFSGDGVRIEQRANLSFGSTERPTLEGHPIGAS
jgi:CubicO group peptidase (beta-lactamase class C family)